MPHVLYVRMVVQVAWRGVSKVSNFNIDVHFFS